MPPAAILAAALAAPGSPAHATLDRPVGRTVEWRADSGPRTNADAAAAAVWARMVAVEGAAWLRVYFADARLGPDSAVRMTSLLDGETQVLDAEGLAAWGNASAYFNGDAVLVELIAGPATRDNRLVVGQVAVPREPARAAGDSTTCGICGTTDDRRPTDARWTSRLLPGGCTAVVYNEASCMVSAGHCVAGSMVAQFNVPDSAPDCAINNPPVADQFPIVGFDFSNGGVGNDWSVLVPGTNGLGEKPYDRYGELRPIATGSASAGQTVDVTGYGADQTCTLSQTQQADDGLLTGVLADHYLFSVDIAPGSSGSAVLRLGEIVGVVTHCPCPNVATRVDVPAFAAALTDACTDGQGGFCPGDGDCCSANGSPGCRDAACCETVCACDPFCCTTAWDAYCAGEGFAGSGCGAAVLCEQCGPCPWDCADGDGTVGIVDFIELLLQWDGPGACDIDGDGTVGITDLLALLVAWGAC